LPDDISLPDSVAVYSNSEELLGNKDIDAVLAATPTLTHLDLGWQVIESGKHLLMEKPIGMTVLEADELAGLALDQHQVFGAVLNQRYDPAYSKIRQMLQQGLLGELQRISWTLTHWYRPEVYFRVSDWRGTWRGEGGGLLLNQCIHNLDVLQWLCGMPTEVWAQCKWGRYHDIEVEDEVTAVMNFSNGASASFISSTGEAPGSNQLTLVGDMGTLDYDGQELRFHQLSQSSKEHSRNTRDMFSMPGVSTERIDISENSGEQKSQHEQLIQDFVDSILTGNKLEANALEASKSVELADSILLSAWTGEKIALPLDRSEFDSHFQDKLKNSQLRNKESLNVTIDLDKSFR
jgi:predicted dehydrogenase